jgi:tetratricopeptide (TPR) repeat protein
VLVVAIENFNFSFLLNSYSYNVVQNLHFCSSLKEAAVLIPEALSALGVLKVITYSDAEDTEENPEDEQKFLQVMHFIHHEYGEYLATEDVALQDLTKDAERQWNRALVEAYLSHVEEWDMDLEDAAHSYSLEMIPSHMIRGGMYSAAADLLADKSFVRGRLLSLGRENSTRRHIKDCEMLFAKLRERRPRGSKLEPRNVLKQAYQALGSQLAIDDEEQSIEDSRIKDVEVARAHYEIGFSLAEKRCWDAAIAHWETSQELLVSALGTVEVVAGILHNIGVVYSEMNEYEQALDSLKQCLRIRGTIHGEEHILYAQTIQKIGDIFLNMR